MQFFLRKILTPFKFKVDIKTSLVHQCRHSSSAPSVRECGELLDDDVFIVENGGAVDDGCVVESEDVVENVGVVDSGLVVDEYITLPALSAKSSSETSA